MNKAPESRFASMNEFASALAKYIQGAAGDNKLGEPTKKATVTVSQIQLTEQSKLAKTLCESGQFVAAVPILKQIIANPEAKGTKMHEWAQTMLPKVETQVSQQEKPKPAAAPQPASQQNPFADLPSVPTQASTTPSATPYRRPTSKRAKAKAKSGPPTAIIGAVVGVLLLLAVGGGVYAFMRSGGNQANKPAAATPQDGGNSAVAVQSRQESEPQSRVKKGNQRFADQLLELFDRNKDGYLDRTELPPPIIADAMIADFNNDDWLTRKELVTLNPSDFPEDIDQMPQPPAPSSDISQPPRFGDLRELDTDGDGQIRLSDVSGPRRLFLPAGRYQFRRNSG